jgi:DNA-binding XRE family transcriptional regulator
MTNPLAPHLIRQHRVRLGMSPEQYGQQVVYCTGVTVRRVERGYTPFLHTQKKFADALEMTVDELFGMPVAPQMVAA